MPRTHRRLRIIARSHTGWHDELFECAPPTGIQSRLGLIQPGAGNSRKRALLVVGMAWLPLVALSTIDGGFSNLTAATIYARYLVAAPLLVLAETLCARRLTAIARHFAVGNFIAERDHRQFERILRSTRSLLRLPLVEVLAWAGAYACTGLLLGRFSSHDPRDWSVAMRWNALVSLPILLVLIFGWAWRFVLWCRFLALVARLDLRLVASHPDRAGGLGFVGISLRAFAPVALALSAIAAGQAARIIHQMPTFSPGHLNVGIGVAVTLVLLFALPIVVFTPALTRAYRGAVMDYGELALDVGRAFESKWVSRRSAKIRAAGLQLPEFSATTDLYQVVSNVYGIRLVPARLADLVVLAGSVVVAYVPLALVVFPPSVIWKVLRDFVPFP
jgi:hypothetical protein